MRFIEEMEDGGWLNADAGDGGYFIFDLGAETAGYLHLELECESETEILIGFGEHLDDLRVRADLDAGAFARRFASRRERANTRIISGAGAAGIWSCTQVRGEYGFAALG